MDLETAKKLIEEEQMKRIGSCRLAIKEALEQHGCELVANLMTNVGMLSVPIELRIVNRK